MISKYRGRRIDNGEWVYGCYVYPVSIDGEELAIGKHFIINVSYSDQPNDGFIEVHPDSVSMWTGLKDKNGVEIYEKDLVEIYNEVFEVKFSEGEFVGDNSDFKQGILSVHELKSSEVIGNTTDTPSLLGDKK